MTKDKLRENLMSLTLEASRSQDPAVISTASVLAMAVAALLSNRSQELAGIVCDNSSEDGPAPIPIGNGMLS